MTERENEKRTVYDFMCQVAAASARLGRSRVAIAHLPGYSDVQENWYTLAYRWKDEETYVTLESTVSYTYSRQSYYVSVELNFRELMTTISSTVYGWQPCGSIAIHELCAEKEIGNAGIATEIDQILTKAEEYLRSVSEGAVP